MMYFSTELYRIVLLSDFQNILAIDIQKIALMKNREDQRNKTKVDNSEYLYISQIQPPLETKRNNYNITFLP